MAGSDLVSVVWGARWPAREAMRAGCAAHGHAWPVLDCTCGLHAARSLSHALRYRRRHSSGGGAVVGCVALWGHVVEAEWGWRAEFAHPLVLFSQTSVTALAETVADRYDALHVTLDLPNYTCKGLDGIAEPLRLAVERSAPRVRPPRRECPRTRTVDEPDLAAAVDAFAETARSMLPTDSSGVPRRPVVARRPRRAWDWTDAVKIAVLGVLLPALCGVYLTWSFVGVHGPALAHGFWNLLLLLSDVVPLTGLQFLVDSGSLVCDDDPSGVLEPPDDLVETALVLVPLVAAVGGALLTLHL